MFPQLNPLLSVWSVTNEFNGLKFHLVHTVRPLLSETDISFCTYRVALNEVTSLYECVVDFWLADAMAPKPRKGGEPRQRYTADMKKEAIRLAEGDYKGRIDELRDHLRRKWSLAKPLPKQTLSDWFQPKAKQTIQETAKKGDGRTKAVRFAKYPELEDLLLPRIMLLEDAGVLTIDILREQAKKLLPSVTFKRIYLSAVVFAF